MRGLQYLLYSRVAHDFRWETVLILIEMYEYVDVNVCIVYRPHLFTDRVIRDGGVRVQTRILTALQVSLFEDEPASPQTRAGIRGCDSEYYQQQKSHPACEKNK